MSLVVEGKRNLVFFVVHQTIKEAVKMRVSRLSSDLVPVSLSFERSTHLQVNCPRFSANSIL